jgi:hypothetical protein
MTTLRLDRIELKNFRCFSQCEIDFHPDLNVLVAENANGKTALLDAVSLALSVYVNAIYPDERLKKIERSDVRLVPDGASRMQPVLLCRYDATGIVSDQVVKWTSTVNTYSAKLRPSTRDLKAVQFSAQTLRDDAVVLPLVAFYGTSRLWSEHRLTEGRRTSQAVRQRCCTRAAICLRSRYLTEDNGITPCRKNLPEVQRPEFRPSTAGSRSTSARIQSVRITASRPISALGAVHSATAMLSSVLVGTTPCSNVAPAASIHRSRATRASLRSTSVSAPT